MLKAVKFLLRPFGLFLGKIFRSRNVIVVSEGEVKHYPVSAKIQFALLVLIMGVLSWGSYSTGSYLATQEILAEKDRKIETTKLENRRIGEQFALLKHDLMKIQDNKDDILTEYDRFVVEQQTAMVDVYSGGKDSLDDTALRNINQNLLQERIDYLEGLVDQLKDDQLILLSNLRARAGEKVTAFQDIIKTTGLNLAKLTKHPQARLRIREIQENAKKLALIEEGEDFINQGGPYLPATSLVFSDDHESLFKDIDQMLLLSDITSALPLAAPMEDARTSSSFGRRKDPITKRWAMHRGLDFVGDYGSKVMSTAPGKVLRAGRNGAYGFMVEIDHGFGVTTRYAHLKKLLVKSGDMVEKGEPIGVQGNSGRSTGSHLHYEVRFDRSAINPYKFIEAGKNVLEQESQTN